LTIISYQLSVIIIQEVLMMLETNLLAEGMSAIGDVGLATLGATIGLGMIVAGGAKGIGNIAGNAVQAIARQPEAGGRVFTSMLIASAFIEGFTLFAIVVCLMVVMR
jgi:F-type H+-transporting ATPase subunit c